MPRWLSRILAGDDTASDGTPGTGLGIATIAPDSVAGLRRRLDADVREVNAAAGEAPGEVVVVARQILDMADDVLRHADVESDPVGGGIDIHGRVALDAILRDYLPTTFRTYLAARRADAATGGHDAAALVRQIHEQVAALRVSLTETLAALRDDDLRALEIQGAFLRTKFTGSDL
ncbi:hypothetical protein [Luteimicrobium subarcticum]|uniref:Uncharacterized protein n=1 Tax=Luteimicrobium subarcticum TaxID=620910 RepID=A0A2M8WW13_9MICO|nr:hypothetical protein [Luteimicrobium subarcticum]PJI95110.1 hypothetical protein CLV34_0963 [Luteimicrobium subarcticum]